MDELNRDLEALETVIENIAVHPEETVVDRISGLKARYPKARWDEIDLGLWGSLSLHRPGLLHRLELG